MAYYYVNKSAQSTGEHEVHTSTCAKIPSSENREFLGSFDSCREALQEARNHYSNVDGCYYCCNSCHKK